MRLDKPVEAEQFLREGLRANPNSYEILFDLGKLYNTRLKRPDRARGVWTLALRRWDEVEKPKEKPDNIGRSSILSHLAELEIESGNQMQAIAYFEEAMKYSPAPDGIKQRISELWLKSTLPPASQPAAPH